MYHYVRDLKAGRYPEIKELDYQLFKEQIQWLKKNLGIIKIEYLIAALPTFDDAYIDNYMYIFQILD